MAGNKATMWNVFLQTNRRTVTTIVASDRPDLMADAGIDVTARKLRGVEADTTGGPEFWTCRAAWWMPFHASAG